MICKECWNSLFEFNNFYEKIEEIHKNSRDLLAKHNLIGDPFDDEHFADNVNDFQQDVQSEYLAEIKEEPIEDFHVDTLKVFGERDGHHIPPKQEEMVTTRKSSRIQCMSLSKTVDSKKQTDPAVGRPRRRNAIGIDYKADQPSSDDDNDGYMQSEESDPDDYEEIKLKYGLRGRRRKSASDTENDNYDTKPEDSEKEEQETEAPLKTSRAKRKKDTKLFEHIDEFICYLCPERVEFERFYHATVHYKKHHKEPAYIKCKICDKRCYTPGNFISHVAVHTDPDKYR